MIESQFLKLITAQSWFRIGGSGSDTFTTVTGVTNKIIEGINFFVGFSALVAVVLIIVGGLKYITAGGDEEKIKQGSATISNTIIGFVIILIASLIVRFVVTLISNTPA